MVVVVAVDKRTGQLVAGPEVVSRGFVYVREAEDLMEEARLQVRRALERRVPDGLTDWQSIKSEVRETLSRFLFERTHRRPMILPIVVEV